MKNYVKMSIKLAKQNKTTRLKKRDVILYYFNKQDLHVYKHS